MTKIITHSGNAHLDDFTACALALVNETWMHQALNNEELPASFVLYQVCCETFIERHDPTEDELADDRTIVLDVGEKYEPKLHNFDHHQLPRGTKESAMSLFAANVGLPCGAFNGTATYEPGAAEYPADSLASFMERAFPWFRTRVAIDACGPFATAKDEGVEWNVVSKFFGPCEDIVLKMFEDATSGERAYIVKPLAEMILNKYAAWTEVGTSVEYDRPWWADGEFTIADFTKADPAKAESCSDMFTREVNGVAIFHDNRGSGLTLLRLRDDLRIDFTKVKDDPEVAFCHNGGFIVKTKSKDLEKAWRLIEDAYQDK